MVKGEKFVTNASHDLTPAPQEVLRAEASGLIVAVDPDSLPDVKFHYFRPSGTEKEFVEIEPM